jgi:HSP20 family protein
MFSPCSSIKETTMFYSVATRPARSFNGSYAPAASHQALEKFLSDTVSSLTGTNAAQPAEVQDLEKSYSLQLDVPGLAKEQLDIGIEGDVVRVSSKADAARSVKAAWRFPLEIDASSSSAKLENGVLTLSLGKKIPVSNISQLAIE